MAPAQPGADPPPPQPPPKPPRRPPCLPAWWWFGPPNGVYISQWAGFAARAPAPAPAPRAGALSTRRPPREGAPQRATVTGGISGRNLGGPQTSLGGGPRGAAPGPGTPGARPPGWPGRGQGAGLLRFARRRRRRRRRRRCRGPAAGPAAAAGRAARPRGASPFINAPPAGPALHHARQRGSVMMPRRRPPARPAGARLWCKSEGIYAVPRAARGCRRGGPTAAARRAAAVALADAGGCTRPRAFKTCPARGGLADGAPSGARGQSAASRGRASPWGPARAQVEDLGWGRRQTPPLACSKERPAGVGGGLRGRQCCVVAAGGA
jgi:hypothetical protein